MKVVGFNVSPRKNGNTAILIQRVFRGMENEGIETEFVQLSHKRIHGCMVSAARRLGAVQTLDCISHFFLSIEMIIVGRAVGMGGDKGEVEKDEGMRLTEALGQRMAWALKRLY